MTLKKFQDKYDINNCKLAELINSFVPKDKSSDYRPVGESSIRNWKTGYAKCPAWIPGFLIMLEETGRVKN